MIVMKFGGSSLATPERCARVTEIIRSQISSEPVIVVSAMGDTTDLLLDLGNRATQGSVVPKEIISFHREMMLKLGAEQQKNEIENLLTQLTLHLQKITDRGRLDRVAQDSLLAFGERLSARILSAFLRNDGIPATALDAWDAGIILDTTRGDALPLGSLENSIRESTLGHASTRESIPVVTGFIARNSLGEVITLGRGGSDLTASVLGAALGASEIQYWKDVDGILTANPSIVADARPVPEIGIDEAAELAYFSASVLHPISIQPAQMRSIPVSVHNSLFPDHPGTRILPTSEGMQPGLRTISNKRNTTLVEITSSKMLGQYGFLAQVFKVFNELKISVDLIATSEVSLTLSLDYDTKLEQLQKELEKIATVNLIRNVSVINLIGNVSSSTKILESTFSCLNREGINVSMISQGTARCNISFVVPDEEAERAVIALHKAFFQPEHESFNVDKKTGHTMKRLPIADESLQTIADRFGTPFHLYDEQGIMNNARLLLKAMRVVPGYKQFFAVKACPNPAIMRRLHSLGFGMDCSSLAELVLAEKTGVRGEEIMFSSNDTPADEFNKAIELGATINLDDVNHIEFLEQHARIPELVSLRFNPGEQAYGNQIIGEPLQAKFGLTREQIFEGLESLRQKGARRFGLHMMTASNELQTSLFIDNAALLFELAHEIKVKLGIEIEFVNLGGGFGIPYRPEQEPLDIGLIARGIRHQYETILTANGLHGLKVYTELGRYVTGPYGYLISRVLHVKQSYKNYVGLDASMADLMRPAIYGAYHHISVVGKSGDRNSVLYDVTGSLCENNDKFAIDRALPEVERGDLLVLHDTGAHGHAMGFNYNGKLRSAELLLLKDGNVIQIRRRETLEDLFRTLTFEPATAQLEVTSHAS